MLVLHSELCVFVRYKSTYHWGTHESGQTQGSLWSKQTRFVFASLSVSASHSEMAEERGQTTAADGTDAQRTPPVTHVQG